MASTAEQDRSMAELIPRRLIQTGRDRNLSLKQRAFGTNLRLLNPEYEWRFFDDADVQRFVYREFPQYCRVFDSFKYPVQRYDLFRYLAVYQLGGFYFDLDVLLATELSALRSAGCVFPFEGLTFSRLLRGYGMDWEIGNYAFGATAGHPFLEAVIENCARAQRDPSWVQPMFRGVPALSKAEHYVLYTTGPGLLSRTLAENPALARTLTVLFPDDVCDVQSWNRFGDFGIHFMDGSWRQNTSVLRRRLAQRWEAWTMERLIRESRRLGVTRRLVAAPI
jgi:inositol phosphorylceramide mannosyltransferase catalytic subunit